MLMDIDVSLSVRTVIYFPPLYFVTDIGTCQSENCDSFFDFFCMSGITSTTTNSGLHFF